MPDLISIKAQQALRSFLAAIVESCDDAIIGTSRDGLIVSWNQGARQIYGYPPDEVLGRPLALLSLPERSDEVPQLLRKIDRGERVTHFETMHLCRDGRVITVSLTLSPILDGNGRIIGASTIARDVTRRIRYEESLREAEQKYRLLFTAGTDAILVTDAETGQVTDYNEAALRLYDYPPEAFSRLKMEDLLAESGNPSGRAFAEPSHGAIVRNPVARHRKRDGATFLAEMSTSTFVWKGRRLQVGIVRDVSEWQRIRELRQALLMASEIQHHLLPRRPPQLSGFEITAESRYCEATGGDYYDFVPLAEEGRQRIGCVVGDVSGHGIAAALLMAMVKGVLRAEVERFGGELSALFRSMNGLLTRIINDDRFITLFFGVLDVEEKTLSWNSAAQGPVFWYRRRQGIIDELPTTGPPLGTLDQAQFRPRGPIRLESGDVVLIGTDGLWESRNPAGEMFGVPRLRQVLATWADKPAAAIHAAVMEKVHAFCAGGKPEDDITLMVLKAR